MLRIPKEQIRAVFTDLDGTLTDNSKIHSQTYQSLWELKRKNFWVVIVSGRPAGWADCLMRLWPIDAMIFENGAGIMTREGDKLKTTGLASHTSQSEQKIVLDKIFRGLKEKIPHLKLASDQPYRLFDYAIDYAEEAPLLTEGELELVLQALSQAKDVTTKLSSIHVNYWHGTHTKLTACEYLLSTEGRQRGISKEHVVFCGDSPNDEPLFQYFPHSVGVANIKNFLDRIKTPPRVITENPGGSGFRELVLHLVSS